MNTFPRPNRPFFSSGPCVKHPGWELDHLKNALISRAHRSEKCKARLKYLIDLSHEILELPEDYRIAIVPGSDTSALECALWSLLGKTGVDVLAWEKFGQMWQEDLEDHLNVSPCTAHTAEYGHIPDLTKVNFDHDVVFCWNGTTSGVKVENADWIPNNRNGLTICDATSALFCMEIDWQKIDVATYSWQKSLGGEAQHGMLILSPRAVERLETYVPNRPLPKIFRLTHQGKLIEGLFRGETMNTPSMLCVEDAIQACEWVKKSGGLSQMIKRSEANFQILSDWVEASPYFDFMAVDEKYRSNSSACMKIIDHELNHMTQKELRAFILDMEALLEEKEVVYDIRTHAASPIGLRIWCGCMIEAEDVKLLLPWLDWAYLQTKKKILG